MNRSRFMESRLASCLSWVLLVVAVVFFLVRVPFRSGGEQPWDYAVCASSSYEWLHGRDPYDNVRVMMSWVDRGADDSFAERSEKLRAIVPPPTLVTLAPFAALPERAGTIVFLWTSFVLIALATWRCGVWADLHDGTRWRLLIAGVVASAPLMMGMLSGNPTILATPLCLIGLERAANGSRILAAVLLAVGTAMKVQIGVPFIVMAVVAGDMWVSTSAVVVALSIAGIGLARSAVVGIDARGEWLRNVAESNLAGGLNDFARPVNAIDLLNLQAPFWSLARSRMIADLVSLSIAAALGLIAASLIWIRRTSEGPLIAACVAGPLLLLPIYHRTYDGLVLMPVFALALSRAVRPGVAIGLLILLSTMLLPPNAAYRIAALIRLPADALAFTAFLAPTKAWATLGMAVIVVVIIATRGQAAVVPTDEASLASK